MLLEATAAVAFISTPWNIVLGLINLIGYYLVTTSNGIMRRSNTSEGQTPGPDRIKCIRKTQRLQNP